jgi:hypothetical protein
MKSLPLYLTTGALALFAAGCGGDDEETTATTGDTASDARGYAETGQAISDICKRADAEIDPISAKATGKAASDAPLLEQVNDANKKYVAEVKAITPDPKLKDAYDGFVAALDQTTTDTDEALAAAQSGDQKAYDDALKTLSDNQDASKPFARALGATECDKD